MALLSFMASAICGIKPSTQLTLNKDFWNEFIEKIHIFQKIL